MVLECHVEGSVEELLSLVQHLQQHAAMELQPDEED